MDRRGQAAVTALRLAAESEEVDAEEVMSFKVTLRPSGHEFEVLEGGKVLDAGLAAGWSMPFSCRQGLCRTCRGRIIEGGVDYGDVHPSYFSEEDKARGLALLCEATPLSDLVIEVEEVSFIGVKPKMIPCRIKAIERPAPDVAIVSLKLPMNEHMMYAAGQHVDFLLKDGRRRSYSIASAPAHKGVVDLELHIRHMPGGVFTDALFDGNVKVRDVLRFEGPLGSFFLREDSENPIIMLASGTGFAPIKALCEYAFGRGLNQRRPITLYWGCRTRCDLYRLELPVQWVGEQPNFRFVPVLSDPAPEDGWTGRAGFVHQAVMEDFPDLSGYQVYACGAPAMVEAARRDFSTCRGLPESEFFADSFISEAERATA